jgi:hypothetical protein
VVVLLVLLLDEVTVWIVLSVGYGDVVDARLVVGDDDRVVADGVLDGLEEVGAVVGTFDAVTDV